MRFNFGGGSYSLGQLLPMRFKPADLLPEPAPPLLLQPQANAVQLTAAARQLLQERAGEPVFLRAAEEALKEAVGSYAPYSRCPAGAAIVTAEGGVYRCGGRGSMRRWGWAGTGLVGASKRLLVGGVLSGAGAAGSCASSPRAPQFARVSALPRAPLIFS